MGRLELTRFRGRVGYAAGAGDAGSCDEVAVPLSRAVVVMDASAHLPNYGDQFPFPFCILSCMASRMAVSAAASSSCGLNITSSVPATAVGTCPGGM
jgi:hypothetical protein